MSPVHYNVAHGVSNADRFRSNVPRLAAESAGFSTQRLRAPTPFLEWLDTSSMMAVAYGRTALAASGRVCGMEYQAILMHIVAAYCGKCGH